MKVKINQETCSVHCSFNLSLPFDAMHALGNVVFALVFGPSFYRFLARFRDKTIIYNKDEEK